ncbi:MAG TPA: prephenate dehydratase [bacterium]|nr:prephenate dehydratase [bacterium]
MNNKLLKQIRKNIDYIDKKIIHLLNERMENALKASKVKDAIEDKSREKQILAKISSKEGNLIDKEFTLELYKSLFDESRTLQEKGLKLIGFQGAHGAYSEMAAKNWNKKLVSIPCDTFAEVFEGVKTGLYDYGILPVENTLGGVVGTVNELLMNDDELKIVGAIEQPIEHCLLYPEAEKFRDIRKVYSHSQAISQCKRFLERNNLEPVKYYDTAGAAKLVAEEKPEATGAIASSLAAELYDLEIVKQNIENVSNNRTRFFILSKSAQSQQGDKCTIIFSTAHKAGTLFNVLSIFADAKINLTRIESMPSGTGNYSFFLDFIGSIKDEKIQKILKEVQDNTENYRFMGCYKERSNQ